jgi:hypothetical protein
MNYYKLLTTVKFIPAEDEFLAGYLEAEGPRGPVRVECWRGPYADTLEIRLRRLCVEAGGGYDWDRMCEVVRRFAAGMVDPFDPRQPLPGILAELERIHGPSELVGGRTDNDCISDVYQFADGHAVFIQGHRGKCMVVQEGPARAPDGSNLAANVAIRACMTAVP